MNNTPVMKIGIVQFQETAFQNHFQLQEAGLLAYFNWRGKL